MTRTRARQRRAAPPAPPTVQDNTDADNTEGSDATPGRVRVRRRSHGDSPPRQSRLQGRLGPSPALHARLGPPLGPVRVPALSRLSGRCSPDLDPIDPGSVNDGQPVGTNEYGDNSEMTVEDMEQIASEGEENDVDDHDDPMTGDDDPYVDNLSTHSNEDPVCGPDHGEHPDREQTPAIWRSGEDFASDIWSPGEDFASWQNWPEDHADWTERRRQSGWLDHQDQQAQDPEEASDLTAGPQAATDVEHPEVEREASLVITIPAAEVGLQAEAGPSSPAPSSSGPSSSGKKSRRRKPAARRRDKQRAGCRPNDDPLNDPTDHDDDGYDSELPTSYNEDGTLHRDTVKMRER